MAGVVAEQWPPSDVGVLIPGPADMLHHVGKGGSASVNGTEMEKASWLTQAGAEPSRGPYERGAGESELGWKMLPSAWQVKGP